MKERPDRQSSRATLQEVASLARVSPTTVSLVLAGKGGTRRISEDTNLRVRQAAESLNYAPNLLTRSLRRGRTHILSFFSSFRNREEDDQYMDKLVAAIESAGGHAGYDILVHCNFRRTPYEICQFLNGGLSDGLLLFAPRPDDPLLPFLRKSALPVTLINGRDPEGMYPSVADDVEAGIRLLVDELVANGHRRIALFVSEEPQARDAIFRVMLLRQQLLTHGIDLPDHRVIHVGPDAPTVISRLMRESDPPTAIFCWHDRLAYRVLAACETIGLPVPGSVSIVGYDGLQWPAATSHVATSVKVDMNSLARRAVSILDQYVLGEPAHLIEDTQPVFLQRGTSLGPAPHMQRSNIL